MAGDDIDTLARTLYGEARANDKQDAQAIANVVINRLHAKRYGSTVAGVCLKPKQFSCWNPTDVNLPRIKAATASNRGFKGCLDIAELAVKGHLPDITGGATHYHTKSVTPAWSKGKTPCFESHDHFYFNDIDAPRRKLSAPLVGSAAATGASFALDSAINQIAPAFPLLGQIVQYAPTIFGCLFFVVLLFLTIKYYRGKNV